MMAEQGLWKNALWLCLKFLVLAPACLVLWLLVLPGYAWVVGQVAGFLLEYVFRMPIDSMQVIKGGFLNTGTQLTFVMGPVTRWMSDLGDLVTNMAPFVALVLATSGLGVRRRLRILLIGLGIIFVSHVVTIVFRFTAGKTALPTAVGLISITLPFLLWIVLAYWDKLAAFLAENPQEPPRPRPEGQ